MDLLPPLGSLHSLETLRLVCCGVHRIPEDISDLKRLNLIHIEKCPLLLSLPQELGETSESRYRY